MSGAGRVIRSLQKGDVCELTAPFLVGLENGPDGITIEEGTIVTVIGYNYAGCYSVAHPCGTASIRESYLRVTSPLEALAGQAE